jgi:hypothetical protein
MNPILQFLSNLFTLFSCTLNTLLLGSPNEPLSERSGRAYITNGKFWLRDIINAIFFWQDNHCQKALDEDWSREIWDWTKDENKEI